MKTLLSFDHNASFVEDCESLFIKVNSLIIASDILAGIKDDMFRSFCKLDYTKRRILFLRHKKNMEYNDIANEVGIKVRAVFYQYNKAVDLITAYLDTTGYTDRFLINVLNDDALIVDEFRRNEIREKRAS